MLWPPAALRSSLPLGVMRTSSGMLSPSLNSASSAARFASVRALGCENASMKLANTKPSSSNTDKLPATM
jgi:hypothetical protein